MTQEYAYGMWVIAAFNVGLFLFFFMSFLPPQNRGQIGAWGAWVQCWWRDDAD